MGNHEMRVYLRRIMLALCSNGVPSQPPTPGVTPLQSENDPRMAFCPACFVEVTPEQAGAQINAARVLSEFAKTAPGRLPSRVQEALAVIDGVPDTEGRRG